MDGGDPVPPGLAELESALAADWREALFILAADLGRYARSPRCALLAAGRRAYGGEYFSEENLQGGLDVTRANPQAEG